MATVRYILSKVGDRPKITLRLRISDNVKVQTAVEGVLAFRQYWSAAKQTHNTKFVNPLILPEVNAVNQTLANLATCILASFAATPIEEVNKNWLQLEVDKVLHPAKYQPKQKVAPPPMLLPTVAEFIDTASKRIQPRKGKPVSRQTVWQYEQMRNYLQRFLLRKGVKDVKVAELDKGFYDQFVAFMYNEGLRPNTVGKHIKNLKAVINSLPMSQRATCEFVESGKCVKITEDVDNVYLTEAELAMLAECDLQGNARLEHVRDAFLLLAWTGCRYSDLGKLCKENICTLANGYQYFKLVQRKTEAKVTIPILPAARAVLEKYGQQLPQPISNQKFNEYLKEVCRLAGINENVTINRNELVTARVGRGRGTTKQMQVVAHQYKKWECVTAHTARRSFATNMYKRNFPTLMIMAITGHKTEKAFLTYIKVSEDENAERMMSQFMAQEYGGGQPL